LELEEITPATQSKLRQVLFKILREADLLAANNIINAALLNPRLLDVIHRGSCRDVWYFPGAYTHSLKSGASLDLFGRLHDDKYYRAFNIFHCEA
jgi:hypothetical protein